MACRKQKIPVLLPASAHLTQQLLHDFRRFTDMPQTGSGGVILFCPVPGDLRDGGNDLFISQIFFNEYAFFVVSVHV